MMRSLFAFAFCGLLATVAYGQVKKCPTLNLCYAIDESGSIGASDFKKQTDAIVAITKQFGQLTGGSVFSAVGFNTRASLISAPTSDMTAITTALTRNTQSRGGTASGTGLKLCQDQLKNLADPRVILLFTDGRDGGSNKGVDAAPAIKASGTTIATVGVGRNINVNDLRNKIASSPDLYTGVASFSALQKAVAKIVNALCVAMKPTPTSSPSMSATPSTTPTPSASASVSTTPSVSASPSASASVSATPSVSASPSASASVSTTPSVSASPSASASVSTTPSVSASPSASASVSTTPSVSASPSASASVSATPSVSASPSASPSPSQSEAPVPPCTQVQCGKCGNRLECYVNSGFPKLDHAVCAIVSNRNKFCAKVRRGWRPHTWYARKPTRETVCGQNCGKVQKPLCFTGKSWPVCPAPISSRFGRVAHYKYGRYPKPNGCLARKWRVNLKSFATYKVCVDGSRHPVSCMTRKCKRGRCSCRW